MFLLETAGDSGVLDGQMRTQQLSSDSASDLLNGPAVLYMQAYDGYSSGQVQGYDASVFQVGASGGTFTVNQSYDDEGGAYNPGKENGQSVAVSFDTNNPDRATFSPGGDSAFLYFFNKNAAFFLDLNGSQSYLETGWLQPQSGTFTDAGIAGNYMLAKLPPLQSGNNSNDAVGEANLSANGAMTGGFTTAGEGYFDWDDTGSMTYNFDSAAFGTFLIGSGNKGMSCAVISPTNSVCMENGSSSPDMMMLQH
jgi:hypothetical protein